MDGIHVEAPAHRPHQAWNAHMLALPQPASPPAGPLPEVADGDQAGSTSAGRMADIRELIGGPFDGEAINLTEEDPDLVGRLDTVTWERGETPQECEPSSPVVEVVYAIREWRGARVPLVDGFIPRAGNAEATR